MNFLDEVAENGVLKIENISNDNHQGFITKTVNRFVDSKYRRYFNNPFGWYLAGCYLPGERQEELSDLRNKSKLQYTLISLTGVFLINIGKLYGAYELITGSSNASSGLVQRIKEVGATGLVIWTIAGFADLGIRTYYIHKNKKPIAILPIELGYRGGVGLFKGIKSIIKKNGNP